MADKLAKLEELKGRLKIDGDKFDADLTEFLVKATSLAEGAELAGRPLVRRTGIVEYPHDVPTESRYLRLERYPIESVASVKQLYHPASEADFADEDALEVDVDYAIDAERGRLERFNAVWFRVRRFIRVEYSGGYIDPDLSGVDLPEGAVQPPASLQQGILQQCVLWWNTRDKAGVTVTKGEAGKADSVKLEAGTHPDLIAACRSLRRYSL